MQNDHWRDEGMRCFGMLIDGRAQSTGIKKRGGDATMLLVFNGAGDGVNFTLPECPGGAAWKLVIDTNQAEVVTAIFKAGNVYTVTGRSVLVFSLQQKGT